MSHVHRGEDQGESLIEILIAVVIMGLAITALISGLLAGSRAADLHREQAVASAQLFTAAEHLKRRTTTYQGGSCDATAAGTAYENQALTSLSGVVTASELDTTVSYWDATPVTGGAFRSTPCFEEPLLQGTASSTSTAGGRLTLVVPSALQSSVTEALLGTRVTLYNGSGPLPPVYVVDVTTGAGASFTVPQPVSAPVSPVAFLVEHPDSLRMQRITLTLTLPSGGADQLSVIKRYQR